MNFFFPCESSLMGVVVVELIWSNLKTFTVLVNCVSLNCRMVECTNPFNMQGGMSTVVSRDNDLSRGSPLLHALKGSRLD